MRHAAELEQRERLAVQADALLAVQHRAGAVEPDQQGGDQPSPAGSAPAAATLTSRSSARLSRVGQPAVGEAVGTQHPVGVDGIEIDAAEVLLAECGVAEHAARRAACCPAASAAVVARRAVGRRRRRPRCAGGAAWPGRQRRDRRRRFHRLEQAAAPGAQHFHQAVGAATGAEDQDAADHAAAGHDGGEGEMRQQDAGLARRAAARRA